MLQNEPVSRAPARSAAPSEKAAKAHEMSSLAEALKQQPGHAPILFRLAQLSEESGKPAEAIAHLKAILAQDPDNVEARLELGKVLFETGDITGSIQETNAILQRQPTNADALYNLGAVYANMGNTKQARRYWTELARSNPRSESARRVGTMLAQLPADAN